jgi:hypothetical protein
MEAVARDISDVVRDLRILNLDEEEESRYLRPTASRQSPYISVCERHAPTNPQTSSRRQVSVHV